MLVHYFQSFLFLVNAQCGPTPNDCDGDGVLNAVDVDDDNDGIPDVDECNTTSIFANGDFSQGTNGSVPTGWTTGTTQNTQLLSLNAG
ncbi:hypothetical protein [Niabella ginsengisoli]|uniref:Uncharacterized protein n=1 Tax=Niabella ginsengisoli TaxID=522298 RepID=A0ABS9SKU4_9BACT|nr:hypothetical protein [Niabella ginsengisoli]MCH5599002.1 hypothetical protein [Niabella ginsengisoli]